MLHSNAGRAILVEKSGNIEPADSARRFEFSAVIPVSCQLSVIFPAFRNLLLRRAELINERQDCSSDWC